MAQPAEQLFVLSGLAAVCIESIQRNVGHTYRQACFYEGEELRQIVLQTVRIVRNGWTHSA